jgi:hypothetical protein
LALQKSKSGRGDDRQGENLYSRFVVCPGWAANGDHRTTGGSGFRKPDKNGEYQFGDSSGTGYCRHWQDGLLIIGIKTEDLGISMN